MQGGLWLLRGQRAPCLGPHTVVRREGVEVVAPGDGDGGAQGKDDGAYHAYPTTALSSHHQPIDVDETGASSGKASSARGETKTPGRK